MIIDYDFRTNEIRIPLKEGDAIVRTMQETIPDEANPSERILIEIEIRRAVAKKDATT